MFSSVDMDVELPEVKMEVEVSFSRKIPVRYRSCCSITLARSHIYVPSWEHEPTRST